MRSSGDDAYNEWIMGVSVAAGHKLNSVRTVLFNNKQASSEPEVLDIIRNSEAIFLAGGDQSEYLSYWAGTEVQALLQSKAASTTLGGTSAGLAVLGNWVYSADKGSVESAEAMADPYTREVTIAPAFLRQRQRRCVHPIAALVAENHRAVTPPHRCAIDSARRAVSLVEGIQYRGN